MLSVRNLTVGYGPIEIVHSVDIDIAAGEFVALIGWSGSGKTTFMKAIAGLLQAGRGEIFYEGRDIVSLSAHTRVTLGIAMVPEGRRLFDGMSVYENLQVGGHTIRDERSVARQIDLIFDLFPVLKERRNQVAGTLSGGEQQMCAVGRALMSVPRLLLIDELSFGLAPVVVGRLVDALAGVRKMGTAIIVVEQDAELALSISDRAYIMQRGEIVRMGASSLLKADPETQREFIAQPAAL